MEQINEIIITRNDILDLTFKGIGVYAHILHQYYPQDKTVLHLKGKKCAPAKNPFHEHALTLHVYIQSDMAMHYDSVLKNFEGNVFAFAALHYKLKGNALLEKINEDMNLNIGQNGQKRQHRQDGQESQESHNSQNGNLPQKDKVTSPMFSYFKKPVRNTVPQGIVNLVDVYRLIKDITFKKATDQLRAIADKEKARKFKEKNFDYATFSGVFSSRENDALVSHSGLLVVDLDHVPDVEKLKQQLLEDDYFDTELLFISPSGNGLKWIISIDIQEATHQEWAKSISVYLLKTYGLRMDPSGKDVARACFLPCDPEVYINPKYIPSTPPASRCDGTGSKGEGSAAGPESI